MSSSHPPSSIPRPSYICLHCGTTETPLWRAGPAGPKTLCNACGVRWKKTGSLLARPKRPPPPPPPSSNAPPKRARAPPSPPRVQLVVPTPKPVSVFRVADASKGRYESVFSGLMRVARGGEGGRRRGDVREKDEGDGASDGPGQVWVTEMLAPSPSPSPPPIPRVRRGGGGMILVVAGKDKGWTARGKDDDLGIVGTKPSHRIAKMESKHSDDINKVEPKQSRQIINVETKQSDDIQNVEKKDEKDESDKTLQAEADIQVAEKKTNEKSDANKKSSVEGESSP